jgi:hypothetical protein
LRFGEARGERQCGSATGETQKRATWKGHASDSSCSRDDVEPGASCGFAAAALFVGGAGIC